MIKVCDTRRVPFIVAGFSIAFSLVSMLIGSISTSYFSHRSR
jgi:hypothetical protein